MCIAFVFLLLLSCCMFGRAFNRGALAAGRSIKKLPLYSKGMRSFSNVEQAASSGELTEMSRLDIRVGKIAEIQPHPDNAGLYVSKVNVGESEPRTIVAGLAEYISKETLAEEDVVVLCNLKPRAVGGILSSGMLLCSSNVDKTQISPLRPPKGIKVGDYIKFAGHQTAPIAASNRSNKAFTRVVDYIEVCSWPSSGEGSTDNSDAANDVIVREGHGVAVYKSVPFMTTGGPCTSLVMGPIS